MMGVGKVLNVIRGEKVNNKIKKKIKGRVVLMKKNVLEFNDFHASITDRVHELFDNRVTFQLISAVNGDSGNYLFLFPSLLCHFNYVQ